MLLRRQFWQPWLDCFEGEPLKGTSLALALVGALVFAASVVAYFIRGIRKSKQQQSLE